MDEVTYYLDKIMKECTQDYKSKEEVMETVPSTPNREEQISATESVRVLEQILTTMTKIASTSEQMLKLMTDAAKSGEKQPVEQDQETENLKNQNQQETQRLDIPGNQAGKHNTK